MFMFTKAFWAYAGERCIKTVAQAGLAAIGSNALGVLALDWVGIGSVAALAGVVSLLTSVVAFPPAKP